jgi:choline dehydrogenase-like flavoprotein
VGTGAGGAVAGAMLAEAGIDTILVEQGKHYRTEDHADILGGLARMYVNGVITGTLGRPPIAVPLGRAVGGTTIVNSSTCFRTPKTKVESWGGPAWDEMVPVFDEVERRINAHVVDVEILGGNWRVLKRGCDAIGVEIKPLMHNVRECKARGRCQYGCQVGAKQSMDLTFVPSALAAGAKLFAEHRVDRVIVKGGKAVGVAGRSPEGAFEVRADVVVLALGALQGPAFLLRQRLANGSGRVGRGLCIHPAARVVAEMDEVVDGFAGLPQGAYIDRWADRGVMLEGVFTPPGLLLASLPGVGREFKDLAARYRNLSAFGVMVNDTNAGRVRRGWLGHPFTAFYPLHPADARSLQFGIARIAEIYFAAGAKRVFTPCAPMPVLDNADAPAAFERLPIRPADIEMLAFHPLGTCRMGADPKASVVDFSLRSHDVPGLYIMDGSVVPGSLGVNPQETIMALAMRAARQLAATLK